MAIQADIPGRASIRQHVLRQRDLAQALAGVASIHAALDLCPGRILEAANLDCGGEEFLLVLHGASLASAEGRAEQMRQKCAELVIRHEGIDLSVTISFGAAGFPDHGAVPEEIIAKADKALYDSKRSGRNRVTVWQNRHGEE